MSAAWFLTLSGWLGIVPGGVTARQIDVLFQSDAALWVEFFQAGYPGEAPVIHPLICVLTRPPAIALEQVLRPAVGPEWSRLMAARILVAVVAGLGVGGLAWSVGPRWRWPVHGPLFVAYLLFTAHVITCMPEHFGLSSGLLSVSYAVFRSGLEPKRKAVVLAGLTLLTGGVTVTNAAVPLAGLAIVVKRLIRDKLAPATIRRLVWSTAGLLLVAALAVGAFWFHRAAKTKFHKYYVVNYFHLRLMHEPAMALLRAGTGLVYPAVGPTPLVRTDRPMVTYEAMPSWPFSRVQAASAVAWLIMLASAARSIRRSADPRIGLLLAGWIAANLLLHTLWGDEFFVYSPHWAWALFAFVLAGSEGWSWRRVMPLCIPLIAGQSVTLWRVHEALAQVVIPLAG